VNLILDLKVKPLLTPESRIIDMGDPSAYSASGREPSEISI